MQPNLLIQIAPFLQNQHTNLTHICGVINPNLRVGTHPNLTQIQWSHLTLGHDHATRMMQNRKEEEEEEKENEGFEYKIGFGFNTKEVALLPNTLPYRDLNHKVRLQCKIWVFLNQLNSQKTTTSLGLILAQYKSQLLS